MTEPRAWTAEEMRADFLALGRALVHYWAGPLPEDRDLSQRLSGLLHSLLCIFDGQSGGFPCAVDLVCRPHPDDKAYAQAEDENWVEDGTVLNADALLHELLYAPRA